MTHRHYIDPQNRWSLIFEEIAKPKNKWYLAIPPTYGDRIDIYSQKLFDKMSHYHFDVECIVVVIKDGQITQIISNISHE